MVGLREEEVLRADREERPVDERERDGAADGEQEPVEAARAVAARVCALCSASSTDAFAWRLRVSLNSNASAFLTASSAVELTMTA